jgi:tetratricopeptide (TPR) repeat protein
MIEPTRVLSPLKEAEGAIAKLQDYQSTAELASAVQATHAAVQRSLRYLLRADKGAPDDLRLAALSPAEMAPDRLIPALRQRNLISLDLAGQIHELEMANERAGRDAARAADSDVALRVVDQLRAEVQDKAERNVREVAHATAAAPLPLDEAHTVTPHNKSGRVARIVIALTLVLVLALVLWLVTSHKSGTDQGIAQFNKGDFNGAEHTLSGVVTDDPGDAQAAYYLAILYRRSQRYEEAGKVLNRGIEKNPNDAYLREEMGNLFMVLAHPDLAAKQYRVAQTNDPGNPRFWVKLVRALRAAGDPEADAVEQQAPEEARAMLQTGQ